ncbi:hypothetical protein B4135_1795 [Caldibacillus debilis]|uniref:Uncharacterized protein n=1 Tax=Caldibacillus debilis TaxID=301148 RepID=A0A150M8H8_9BACI|nr:hypothetical protein B4135_1795 [Caldibacillus debilis]
MGSGTGLNLPVRKVFRHRGRLLDGCFARKTFQNFCHPMMSGKEA